MKAGCWVDAGGQSVCGGRGGGGVVGGSVALGNAA